MYPNQPPSSGTSRLIIPLILASIAAIGLGVTTVWFFTRYSDAQNNLDAKVATAVETANQSLTEELKLEFAEESKNPNKSFVSGDQTGNVSLTYPKTWSALIEEGGRTAAGLDAYFFPDYIPGTDDDINFALRVTVETRAYASEVASYQRNIDDGSLKAKAIKAAGVTGVRLDGVINREKTGALVLFPIRDKTLKIWTESPNYLKDFNDIVLKNLTFNP